MITILDGKVKRLYEHKSSVLKKGNKNQTALEHRARLECHNFNFNNFQIIDFEKNKIKALLQGIVFYPAKSKKIR